MQRIETSSWRLEIDGDQSAHLILCVRDACALSPIGLDVPPPLISGVGKLDLGLNPLETAELTSAWSTWWRKFVHEEGVIDLGEFYQALSREERRDAEYSRRTKVFDPPRFESLASCRPLQEVAQRQWPLGESLRMSSPYIYQPLTEKVVKRVFETRGVVADKLRATVTVLSVEGIWSFIPEPGLLLCSEGLFGDRELYALELQKVFESRLG
ncbi:MAG TPA: hypothetical protein VIJ86_01600 [Acidimicrobiales bacterium]